MKDRNWYHIIGWWEIRRLFFNAILLLFGLISLLIFLFVFKFDANIIHPFLPIAFGLLANFFLHIRLGDRNNYKTIQQKKSNFIWT